MNSNRVVVLAVSAALVGACNKPSSSSGPAASASPSGSSAPASVAAASATAAGGAASAASGSTAMGAFEGDVTMHISGGSLPNGIDMTFELKGQKVRYDMASFAPGMPAMWGVEDPSAHKVYTVLDAQKMVMEQDIGTGSGAAGAAPSGGGAPPKIDKTGKTDTVAGQTCQIWNVTSANGQTAELCVVTGVQALPFGQISRGPGADFGWASGLGSEGVWPLRAIVHGAGGAEVMRMETTKIEKKSIDDSRFQIPAGYQTMNAPAMPGGARPF